MIHPTPRLVWSLLAVGSALLALASLTLSPWLNLHPCHLCVFQRLLFMLLALLATLAAVMRPPRWPPWVAAPAGLIFLLLATLGSAVAAYQSALQWRAADLEDVSCLGAQPGPIELLVEWLGQRIPSLFMASGFCEETELVILGLSLANWAFLSFISCVLAAGWALWRDRRLGR